MKTNPLVTIGIATYNSEHTVQKSIDSAVSQDWDNLEIIIIDDCSSDSTWEIVSSFVDVRIKTHRNLENMGAGYTRNKILSESRGDVICFLDDDDIALPNRVSCQIRTMISHGYPLIHKVINVCGMIRCYPNGYLRDLKPLGTYSSTPTPIQLIDYILFNQASENVDYGFCIPTCAFMATTAFLRDIGGFDPSLRRVEDADLTIRLCFDNAILTSINSSLVLQQSTNGPHKSQEQNYRNELKLINKYSSYLQSKNMYLYALLSAELRFAYFKRDYRRFLLTLCKIILHYPIKSPSKLFRSFALRLRHELLMVINNYSSIKGFPSLY